MSEALYSPDPAEREAEAKKYRVFHRKDVKIPCRWRRDWDNLLRGKDIEEGLPWPDNLLTLVASRDWPEYTFGTANASCLVVLHMPGASGMKKEDTYIAPILPVLGWIPHAHNRLWSRYNSSQTWKSLYGYLTHAFDGLRLKDPWSQVMTTCINPKPGRPGDVDRKQNRQAFERDDLIDFLVELCQPRIILLCGTHVRNAALNWKRPHDVRIFCCHHPSARGDKSWDAGEGGRVQQAIRKSLSLYE